MSPHWLSLLLIRSCSLSQATSATTYLNPDGLQRLRLSPHLHRALLNHLVRKVLSPRAFTVVGLHPSRGTHHKPPCEIICVHVWSRSNKGFFRNLSIMSQIPVCSGHLPQPSVPSTLPVSPDDLGKGTFSDNRVIGSLPPLYRQVLGSSWLTPTTSTAEPEPSAQP